MRIAVLDLGTNIFNLLIVDKLENNKWNFIEQQKTFVQLGEGGMANNSIIPSAVNRAILTLEQFASIIQKNECDKIYAFGTSAMRNAKNGKDLVQKIHQKTGINIQIIDGNREAELIYYGVRFIYPIPKTSLIMDIGGGSVEFILAKGDDILWRQSFEVGGQRLFDMFHKTDPIPTESMAQLFDYLDDKLQDLIQMCQKYPPVELIGTAGTFEVIYEIFLAESDQTYERNKFTTLLLPESFFNRIYQQIVELPLESRKNIKGMAKDKASMITVASALISFVLKEVKPKQIRISPSALKEGCLYLVAQNKI